MKVFISWSGERSKLVAQALHEWMPLVLHFVEPWLSDKDIEAGERWIVELGKELQDSKFGIIVVTPENVKAPWLLFEAGALSNAFSLASVCPYLVELDLKDLSGPLFQFQAKKADRPSTFQLLQAMNSRAEKPLDQGRLSELFDALWPRLEQRLSNLPGPSKSFPSRSTPEVMEELVEAVRRMETRLEGLSLQSAHTSLPAVVASSILPGRVVVKVRGEFPRLANTKEFRFSPGKDLISDIAGVAGVSVDEYGSTWSLREPSVGHTLARDDGKRYAIRGHKYSLELLLVRHNYRKGLT